MSSYLHSTLNDWKHSPPMAAFRLRPMGGADAYGCVSSAGSVPSSVSGVGSVISISAPSKGSPVGTTQCNSIQDHLQSSRALTRNLLLPECLSS